MNHAEPNWTLSRRQFLGTGIATGVALTLTGMGGRARAAAGARRVAVLGGGIAGLTAAHELIERGFEVAVYERKALGGKARSIPTDLPTAGARRPLPGEHGFRFFPASITTRPTRCGESRSPATPMVCGTTW